MEEKDIIARVNAILMDKLGVENDEIKPEASFTELGADSLDTVEIQMDLEQEFDIALKDDDVEKLKDVQGLYDIVVKAVQVKV